LGVEGLFDLEREVAVVVVAVAERPAGVIAAILTDGLENSSREYTRQEVFDRIRQRQAEGWEFVFLAANQDAAQEGSVIGIQAQDACAYAHSGEGVREAWSGISGRTSRIRSRQDATGSGILTPQARSNTRAFSSR